LNSDVQGREEKGILLQKNEREREREERERERIPLWLLILVINLTKLRYT
jgi:hypothetical protein